MKPHDGLRILLVDLELTFGIYYAYPSKREQYLSDKNIKHDQFCTCAAWKWSHENKTYSLDITQDKKRFKKNFRDDFIIAKRLHEIMEEADVIVAHNGDKFDILHANTLFRKHKLGPIPLRKSIDTLKMAKKYFAFPGNSLDSLAKRFGSKGKNQKPDWKKMTEGDKQEIIIAAKYCKNDVIELEKVFNEIKPYIHNFPTLRKRSEYAHECECCSSKRLRYKGRDFDGKKMYNRYKCIECGHPMRVYTK